MIEDIIGSAVKIFEEKLTGIYLHGSMAFGCYNPHKSDIDFIVAVNSPVTEQEKADYITELTVLESRADAPKKGIEMSVVLERYCRDFVYPTPYELHYSAAHRERFLKDPKEYCRNMRGTDKDLAAHFTVIKAAGRTLYGKSIKEVFGEIKREYYLDSIMYDVENAAEDIAEEPVYIILNLCRVLAFVREGKVMSKADGAEWALKNLPEKYVYAVDIAAESYRSDSPFPRDIPTETLREFAEKLLELIMDNSAAASPQI